MENKENVHRLISSENETGDLFKQEEDIVSLNMKILRKRVVPLHSLISLLLLEIVIIGI